MDTCHTAAPVCDAHALLWECTRRLPADQKQERGSKGVQIRSRAGLAGELLWSHVPVCADNGAA
jgi:uncharacterized protein (DUF488 family)